MRDVTGENNAVKQNTHASAIAIIPFYVSAIAIAAFDVSAIAIAAVHVSAIAIAADILFMHISIVCTMLVQGSFFKACVSVVS
jgi:hypothetical protein